MLLDSDVDWQRLLPNKTWEHLWIENMVCLDLDKLESVVFVNIFSVLCIFPNRDDLSFLNSLVSTMVMSMYWLVQVWLSELLDFWSGGIDLFC